MAERVVERTETDAPRETVVVHDNDRPVREGTNTGVIIAVIVLAIILLLLIFGRGLFGGNNGGSNVQTPSTSTSAQ